jgi:hypothetical protein
MLFSQAEVEISLGFIKVSFGHFNSYAVPLGKIRPKLTLRELHGNIPTDWREEQDTVIRLVWRNRPSVASHK